MAGDIFNGLALVDAAGRAILVAILASALLAIGANLFLRRSYANLQRDLRSGGGSGAAFEHPVLNHVVRDALQAAHRPAQVNVQSIVEERFAADLGPLLLAERYVRAATGLVIILGLLGTFYGLTLSVGRLVLLVSGDGAAQARDVAETVTSGLSHALAGMAVAFSNSLLGIASAVVLTVFGIFSGVTERRMALTLELETFLDRLLAGQPARAPTILEGAVAVLGQSSARLDAAAQRLESAIATLCDATNDFKEFTVQIVPTRSRDRV